MGNHPLTDRMKSYEGMEAERHALPLLPVLARLDGRRFSRWTRDLHKPFDEEFHRAMGSTTAFLVQESCALLGYTQSDEITLVFYSDQPGAGVFFEGRLQKMCSMLASLATWKFNDHVRSRPHFDHERRGMALFDCRVWQVPNQQEAANVIVWREGDAVRNSVLAAAQSLYSHSEVMGRKSPALHEMLFRKGVNWNDYPAWARRGSYYRRETRTRVFTEEEWLRIPEAHRPPREQAVSRKVIERLDMPPFRAVENRVGVIFRGESPVRAPRPSPASGPEDVVPPSD